MIFPHIYFVENITKALRLPTIKEDKSPWHINMEGKIAGGRIHYAMCERIGPLCTGSTVNKKCFVHFGTFSNPASWHMGKEVVFVDML